MNKILIFFFLSLHLLSLEEVVVSEESCPPTEQQTVYIINKLPVESSACTVYCRLHGRQLADEVLHRDQQLDWTYCDPDYESEGWRQDCHLDWMSKKASFDAFFLSKNGASKTVWTIRSDGVYLNDTAGKKGKVNWSK